MVRARLFRVTILLCVFGLLATGCRTARGRRGGDDIEPEEVPFVLGERFEDGTRITDVEFENVHFAFDSFQIAGSEVHRIERVGEYLRSNSGVKLITEGHCDERGSREYNMSLGEHRALAVRAYLIGLGIDGSRIQTRSYGEERPLDPGHNESAWRLNRRVEFALYR